MKIPRLKFPGALAGVVAAIIGLAAPLPAYDLIGSSWPDGNIVMQLQLGQPSSALVDGDPDWATVAESALNEWNGQIARHSERQTPRGTIFCIYKRSQRSKDSLG